MTPGDKMTFVFRYFIDFVSLENGGVDKWMIVDMKHKNG